jgi:glycine betaine/choline ABC-type transport system substrate-binding protein
MDRTKTVALLIVSALAGCSSRPRVVVGSKNFTEQVVLGEIVAQLLEKRLSVTVDRRLNLGGTLLAHEALVRGDIDLYPEYTGTALTAILKQPPTSDPAAALEKVRSEYRRQWALEWLPPLGFNDTFAMIVRTETARQGGFQTLTDAARQPWRLGAGYEFQQRADGLAGLLKTYGLRTEGAPVSMDLGLLYQALNTRKVDMIAANSTDGLAASPDLTILRDDRRYFPPYECAVVVRSASLARLPNLRAALEELGGKIPDAEMRKLNYEVDGKRRTPRDVARDFLASTGIR